MILNLISPKGEKKSFKLGILSFLVEGKIKSLLNEGWTCESEKDADIVYKRNLI